MDFNAKEEASVRHVDLGARYRRLTELSEKCEVISVVVDSISFHYEQHAAVVLGKDHILEPTTGSVTFVQFFGSSFAPNPHLHIMFLDGVFASRKEWH